MPIDRGLCLTYPKAELGLATADSGLVEKALPAGHGTDLVAAYTLLPAPPLMGLAPSLAELEPLVSRLLCSNAAFKQGLAAYLE
jgi:hypothetical protein